MHNFPDGLLWALLAIVLVAPLISTGVILLIRKLLEILPNS